MVDAFVGDEYFGAERFVVLHESMVTTVKIVQKVSSVGGCEVDSRNHRGPLQRKGQQAKPGRQGIHC